MSNHYPLLITLPTGFSHALVTDRGIATLRQAVVQAVAWTDTTADEASWTWRNTELATISIEMVRDLILELSYASYLGKPRVIGLLAADKLSPAAQHAVLKSLEEPPTHTVIVLATDAPQFLLDTIKSRCQMISLVATQTGLIEPSASSLSELTDLTTFVTGQADYNHGRLISLVESLKDRAVALTVVDELISAVHHQLTISPNLAAALTKTAQQLLNSREQLQANANVQLTLEHCLFEIKRLY